MILPAPDEGRGGLGHGREERDAYDQLQDDEHAKAAPHDCPTLSTTGTAVPGPISRPISRSRNSRPLTSTVPNYYNVIAAAVTRVDRRGSLLARALDDLVGDATATRLFSRQGPIAAARGDESARKVWSVKLMCLISVRGGCASESVKSVY